MVFVKFGLLHLVAVASTNEPASHLVSFLINIQCHKGFCSQVRQLKCMHSQILSTVPGIDKILLTKPNFDIRGFLTGNQDSFVGLINLT